MQVAERVIQLINDTIENVHMDLEHLDDDLTAMGMDSISFIRLIVLIEDEFDLEIPDDLLLLTEMNTAGKIIEILANLEKVD